MKTFNSKKIVVLFLALALSSIMIQCVTDDKDNPHDSTASNYVGDSSLALLAEFEPDCKGDIDDCIDKAREKQQNQLDKKNQAQIEYSNGFSNNDTIASTQIEVRANIVSTVEIAEVTTYVNNKSQKVIWDQESLEIQVTLKLGKNIIITKILQTDAKLTEDTLTLIVQQDVEDKEAPVIKLDSLSDTTYTSSITLKGEVYDASQSTITVNEQQTIRNGTQWELKVSLNKGANSFLITAIDNAPNSNTRHLNVNVFYIPTDTISLSIQFTSPKNTDTTNLTQVPVVLRTYGSKQADTVYINDIAGKKGSSNSEFTEWTAVVSIDKNKSTTLIATAKNNRSESASDTISLFHKEEYSGPIKFTLLGLKQHDTVSTPNQKIKVRVQNPAKTDSMFIRILPSDAKQALQKTDDSTYEYTLTLTANVTTEYNLMTVGASSDTIAYSLYYTSDTTAPTVSFSSHTNYQALNTNKPLVKFKIEDLSSIREAKINGTVAILKDNYYTSSITLSTSDTNKITVIAKDNWGNSSTHYFYLVYDTTAPELNLLQPQNQQTIYTPRVKVKINTTDQYGIKKVLINGKVAETASDYYYSYVDLKNGANSFDIISKDSAGNEKKLTLKLTGKDTTAPVISLVGLKNGDTVNLNTLIKLTVADPSGVKWVKLGGTDVPKSGKFYKKDVVLKEGANKIILTTADAIPSPENIATFELNLFGIDTIPPSFKMLSHTSNDTIIDTSITNGLVEISFNVADPSGISLILVNSAVIAIKKEGIKQTATVSLKEGANQFTISLTDNSSNKNKIEKVINLFRYIPVDSVSVTNPFSIKKGDTKEPKITFYPPNATNKKYRLTLQKATSNKISILEDVKIKGLKATDAEPVIVNLQDFVYLSDTTNSHIIFSVRVKD